MTFEGNLLPSATTVQIEKNLTSFGFFVPSGKRIKNGKIRSISFNRFLDDRKIRAEVIIIPSTRHGLPVTSDQDKYFALQRIITDLRRRHGTIQNPIGFRSAELLGILGRHSRSGRHYQRIREWLDLMAETTIVSEGAIYLAGSKTWASGRVRVFDRALTPGEELASGNRAAKNYVWLSGWQLENINHNHLLGLDLDSYLRLTNHGARALAPLLHVWLYASRSRDLFEKRYDELCRLLNLRCYDHASKIIEKLAPSLDELLGCGYLAGWSLETRSGGKGYKLRLHHKEAVVQKQSQHPSRRVQIHSSATGDRSLELSSGVNPAGQDPALIEEMRKRGIPSDRARQLLSNLAGDQLVMDQLEWGDHLIRSRSGPKISNTTGFYIYLVKENIRPPDTFETSRIRRLRAEAETARVKQLDERAAYEVAYQNYRSEAIDSYLSANFSEEEYRDLLERKMQELASRYKRMAAWKPEVLSKFLNAAVRADVEQRLSLMSFETFCEDHRQRLKVERKPVEAQDISSDVLRCGRQEQAIEPGIRTTDSFRKDRR